MLKTHIWKAIISCFPLFIFFITSLACNVPDVPLPNLAPSTSETPAGALKTGAAPTGQITKQPEIPAAIFTEVAGTIQAHLTQTASIPIAKGETKKPTAAEPSPALTQEPPQAPIPISTFTATNTATHTQVVATPEFPQPPIAPTSTSTQIPVFPPLPSPGQSSGSYATGHGFKVLGLNIHWCGSTPWAIYKVRNTSNQALESLSLFYQDLSTNQTLFGPAATNAPFITTDKTCIAGGISKLVPGQSLYIGNTLASGGIREHIIQATIILCSGDGLNGNCYQQINQFVMP